MRILKLISIAFLSLVFLFPLSGQNKSKTVQAPLLKAVDSVYSVKTADELRWLVTRKSDYEGFTIRLENDIDFGEKTPLNTGFKQFAGTFDGNGKTIRNFKMITTMKDWGDRGSAFIFINNGTIKDLTLHGLITGIAELALLVGENNGLILNCTTRGKVAVTGAGGGIVYHNTISGTIQNCRNYAEVGILGKQFEPAEFGGIVTLTSGKVIDSHNYGTITGSVNVGGIAAIVKSSAISATLKGCVNYGQVLGNNNVGGIAGYAVGFGMVMDSCVNAGIVRGSNNYTAGILAYNQSVDNFFRNCRNTGLVSGGVSHTGGIVALDYDHSPRRSTFEACGNSGVVESQGEYVGGIVAATSSHLSKCWNIGEVSGTIFVGGLVGTTRREFRDKIEITQSFNAGVVRGENWVGGIAGHQPVVMKLNQTYNSGPVKGKTRVGGLVGVSESEILNSYNCGPVDGENEVGGISGNGRPRWAGANAFIQYCYNAGRISFVSRGAQLGEFFSDNNSLSNFFHIDINPALKGMRHFDSETAENSFNGVVLANPLSGEAFGTQASYTSFDFDKVWVMAKDQGTMKDYRGLRPMLRSVGEGDPAAYQSLKTRAESDRLAFEKIKAGIAEGPALSAEEMGTPVLPVNGIYTVRTADELRYLMNQKSNYKGETIRLAADIDFGKRVLNSGFPRMAGTIDGAGFALKNLTIVPENLIWLEAFPQSVGFVSILESTGLVKNLRIESGRIDGGARAGSIAGHSFGSIINCSNKASVSGTSGVTAGGIVGVVDSYPGIKNQPDDFVMQRVQGCTNSGTVTGYQAGGIAGYSRTAYVIDCKNSGRVNAYYAAGIVNGHLAVSGCTNSGAIGTKDTQRAAGIISTPLGDDEQPDASRLIINCHNTGAVQANLIASGVAMKIPQGMVNCSNSGSITSHARHGNLRYNNSGRSTSTYGALAAGLLAYADENTAMVNCINTGKISTQIGTAGGLIAIDTVLPSSSGLNPDPDGRILDFHNYFILYHCLSLGEVSSATGLAGIVIGEKAELNNYIGDPRAFASVAKSKDVFFLKSASKNAKIPPVNFAQLATFKIDTTGLIPVGNAGMSSLPKGWDPQIWKIQPKTKTTVAMPVLNLSALVLPRPALVPPAKPESARWKFGQATSDFGIMIFDKGSSRDGWRYLSVYKGKNFGSWEADPDLLLNDGQWFYPDSDLLYSLWQYLVVGERYNLPMGLYYTSTALDADQTRVLDFFTGRWIVVPNNFRANRMALQKFQ